MNLATAGVPGSPERGSPYHRRRTVPNRTHRAAQQAEESYKLGGCLTYVVY